MRHKDAPIMDSTWEELQTFVLSVAPPEKRLQGLSPEERLDGLSAEERVQGLSAEERVNSLGDAELQKLKRLLEQRLPPESGRSS